MALAVDVANLAASAESAYADVVTGLTSAIFSGKLGAQKTP
jgi:hypothetical protein